MWTIKDELLAQMWREKNRFVLSMSVVLGVFAGALDYYNGRLFAVYCGIAATILLLILLWSTRYRMHRGVYGQRAHEANDFDRWIANKGGTRIDGMNLPG